LKVRTCCLLWSPGSPDLLQIIWSPDIEWVLLSIWSILYLLQNIEVRNEMGFASVWSAWVLACFKSLEVRGLMSWGFASVWSLQKCLLRNWLRFSLKCLPQNFESPEWMGFASVWSKLFEVRASVGFASITWSAGWLKLLSRNKKVDCSPC
jgi:hypothetical protein